MLPVEGVIAIRPDYLPREVQGRIAAVTETGVDALSVRRRGRRGITVPALLPAKGLLEHRLIPELRAGLSIQRQEVTGFSAVGGGGDEDSVFPHDRRGPRFPGKVDSPCNIAVGRPSNRDA